MSVYHSIHVELDLSFSPENVGFVAQRIADCGVVYLAVDNFSVTSRRLTVTEAALELLTVTEEIEDDGGPFVYGKFEDTGISIWTQHMKNGLIKLNFGSFSYQWNRDFSNGLRRYTIDFARYIRLISQMCKDMKLLKLYTCTDELDEIWYDNKSCATVLLNMGNFVENPENINDGKLSLESFVRNAQQNGMTFFDGQFKNNIEPSIQEYYDIIKAGLSTYLYAKRDEVPFKIEIKRDNQGYDLIVVYPLEPYPMKKGYGSEDEKVDVTFYVERLIELCENFAIYELKTFI